jgi:spermidine/putrescine transport system substrate-binding protein
MSHHHPVGCLDRRSLLRRAGFASIAVGMTPAMLAACGDDDDGGSSSEAPASSAAPASSEAPASSSAPATSEAAPESTAAASSAESSAAGTTAAEGAVGMPSANAAVPAASGTEDFLSWEGYDIPDQLKAWREKNGVEVKATYIANHDEIQAKLLAGGGSQGYDIITYYQGYRPLYTELGILEPLDVEKIPNLVNLLPYFASGDKEFWVGADGVRTGIPWTWGSIGITYDSAVVTTEPTSWMQLLEPEWKGKVGLPDDPVGSFTLACHVLGKDPAAVPKADVGEVVDFLKQIIGQSKSIAPSFGDLATQLVSGDVAITWQGWAAMNSFAAAAGKDTVKTVVPKEGAFSFCDAYALPKGADNADTTYSWMNEALDPKVNADAAVYLVGGVTVTGAPELLDDATRSLYPYEDLDGLLERAPFYNNPPKESDEYVTFDEWQAKWQEIKAGS